MKLGFGSLQRKGRRWYLVVYQEDRQRWIALKTDKASVASVRARQLIGLDTGTLSWMRHLALIGKRAEGAIKAGRNVDGCSWQNLPEQFATLSGEDPDCASYSDHNRYLRHLNQMSMANSPLSITADEAREIACRLGQKYIAADRMVRFYKRVWRTMGWDDSIWSAAMPLMGAADCARHRREYYRRLTGTEIVSIFNLLRHGAERNPVCNELSDMIVIGYYTGLRLSDVAELEICEVDESCRFLKIVPNKTRRRKRLPLTVPLVREAQTIVQRRMSSPQNGFLFCAEARYRPSRKLSAYFRQAHINKLGNGRASFHSLRATFISQMDEAGIPPHITDSITGQRRRHARPLHPAFGAGSTRRGSPGDHAASFRTAAPWQLEFR